VITKCPINIGSILSGYGTGGAFINSRRQIPVNFVYKSWSLLYAA